MTREELCFCCESHFYVSSSSCHALQKKGDFEGIEGDCVLIM